MQRTAHIADRKRDKRMAGMEVSESDIKSISLESSASCNLSIFLHSFDCCMALLHSHCLTWSFDFSCFFRFQSRHAKQIRRLLSPKLNSKCVSNAFGIFIVLLILPSFSPSELDLHSVSVCVCVLSMLFAHISTLHKSFMWYTFFYEPLAQTKRTTIKCTSTCIKSANTNETEWKRE